MGIDIIIYDNYEIATFVCITYIERQYQNIYISDQNYFI